MPANTARPGAQVEAMDDRATERSSKYGNSRQPPRRRGCFRERKVAGRPHGLSRTPWRSERLSPEDRLARSELEKFNT